jgi:hypothetical protein
VFDLKENLEEMMSHGTDAYGAQCGHIQSAVVRVHLSAIPEGFVQIEGETSK